jgi:N-acetylmuramic acid 6-phosphate etherase
VSRAIPSRAHIATEAANPRTEELDTLSIADALTIVQREDARIHSAIAAAHAEIAAAITLIHERLQRGGRLFYVGAGTSGRLGVLDAVECPPTFRSSKEQVQGILAGGQGAMFESLEGAEDSDSEAAQELRARNLEAKDVVFGITAGGTTPFVHGALAFACEVEAGSVMLACVPFDQAPDQADVSIRLATGPEILQGSTRLKAGTATKLVLNSISTLVMVQLGKVFGNRMVDVNTSGNIKLQDRGIRLVQELCELDRTQAEECLAAAGGEVKLALLMHKLGLGREEARALIKGHAGHLRRALKQKQP